MAGEYIQSLTELTDPATGDVVHAVDDPTGTPADRKLNVGKLVGYLATTKGDSLWATAARAMARLAVGTDGQKLRADSTISVGAAWYTEDGWTPSGETWTFATASTFTISGDLTTKYQVGLKIRLKQGGAYKYFVIASATYSNPNTTVTVIVSTDYTIANAGITNNDYSHAVMPFGWPDYFAYTPTGLSAAGVTMTGRWKVQGRTCTVDLLCAFTGAITFTTHPTLPVAAASTYKSSSDSQAAIAGVAAYWDNGTARVAHTMFPRVKASDTTVGLYRAADAVAISATVPITWANLDELTAHFQYEI